MTGLPLDQILAAFMFAGMIAFLFLGFPVAFSLTFTGFLFGGLAILCIIAGAVVMMRRRTYEDSEPDDGFDFDAYEGFTDDT